MPSEKKNKKSKAASSSDSLKPMSSYVGDRLELTKQLFSCLKNKQVKQRLPPNLINMSIERVQQICLDEILGISSKRLVSIINNTKCPEETDSDDSEVEHFSLEEISSDSEEATSQSKSKNVTKKQEMKNKNSKDQPKSAKEMTMLELLELQARARAIRSQLALEPVTKIELDSDEEGKSKSLPTSSDSLVSDKNKEDKRPLVKKSESSITHSQKNIIAPSVNSLDLSPKPILAPIQSTKPVKLKRNYKKQTLKDVNLPSTKVEVELSLPVATSEDHCSSPDVITMDPSPETFFISDSDDEPPLKKSPNENEDTLIRILKTSKVPDSDLSVKSTRESSMEAENCEREELKVSGEDGKKSLAITDEDVVHLTSDTEIELNLEGGEEVLSNYEKKSEEKPQEAQKTILEARHDIHSDDDVVEINNSSDDDMLNESDKSASGSTNNSQTWEDRWLSSSKTQSILKTTKFESKVRSNMLRTKKSQKSSEKKMEENEKEKVVTFEEGSMEQFKTISNCNSNVN